MYGATLLALAAAVSALPATLNKRIETRDSLLDSNLFICPGNAPHGGCALNGNPYYVNEATTGTVVADLLGIWACPTTYGTSNITALCCSDLSHDGDYDYSTWCDTPYTTTLSTAALLSGSSTPSTSGPTADSGSNTDALDQLIAELETSLEALDLTTAEAQLEAATKQFDLTTLDDALAELTAAISAAELEADLAKVTDSL